MISVFWLFQWFRFGCSSGFVSVVPVVPGVPVVSFWRFHFSVSGFSTCLLRAQTLPIHFLCYKLLAETMHDVSNDVIPSQLKDLFIPTVKIHSYNT